MSRSYRRPFLPAGVFDQWGLPADDPRRNATQVLNPLEADRPQLATTLLAGAAGSPGAQRVPRSRRRRAVRHRQVVEPTSRDTRRRTDPDRPQADRRRDRHARRVAADVSPQHVGAVLTGLREPAGPWGPGRPVDATDAFEAVRIIGRAAGVDLTLRAAQYLPWHPGRCAEVLFGDTVVGHAGQLHPAVIERSGLPKGTCAVELDLDADPDHREPARSCGVAVPRGVPGRQR